MLAGHLKSTVGELQERMTLEEFNGWIEFDRLYPLNDHHRIYRPAALIAASMSGDYDNKLEFLSPDPGKSAKPIGMAKMIRPAKE